MNRKASLVVMAVAVSAAFAWASASRVGPADYTRLDGDAEPLRSAFNADVAKVRVLMLVAPT